MSSIIIEPLRAPRARAGGQHRGSTTIPPGIVGTWSVVGSPFLYEFSANGDYLIFGSAPFSVASDGLSLDINGTVYERVFGAGTDIVGVWSHEFVDDGLVEELYFRADESHTVHWSDGQDYFGTYSASGGTLSRGEFGAVVETVGTSISFDPPYGAVYSGDFTLNGDTLTIVFPAVTVIYDRVI